LIVLESLVGDGMGDVINDPRRNSPGWSFATCTTTIAVTLV